MYNIFSRITSSSTFRIYIYINVFIGISYTLFFSYRMIRLFSKMFNTFFSEILNKQNELFKSKNVQ